MRSYKYASSMVAVCGKCQTRASRVQELACLISGGDGYVLKLLLGGISILAHVAGFTLAVALHDVRMTSCSTPTRHTEGRALHG